ncbi:hypothetical protein ACVW1C_004498 [Bradyrhizobium sp. USDA 4011]
MTLKPRNILGVVPAEAGTHNTKCKSLRDAGSTSPGVWIPADYGERGASDRTAQSPDDGSDFLR